MADYVIGDIQGCNDSFQALLEKVKFDSKKDCLFLLGDLVNRGPKSLEVLRWIVQNQDSIRTVLGNHDFLLLHCYWNGAKLRSGDTIQDILEADDADSLVDWLSAQPLVYEAERFSMVHAGIHPHWNWSFVLELSRQIQGHLVGLKRAEFVQDVFDARKVQWNSEEEMYSQVVSAANTFTRTRVCDADGNIDFKFKAEPDGLGEGAFPWFGVPERESLPKHLYFGHWSALGLYQGPLVTCLDTGCVWGRKLTAIRLDDKKVFQQPAVD